MMQSLVEPAENGHLEVVNRLLQDERVDPSARDSYPIRAAHEKGHLDVISRLLEDSRLSDLSLVSSKRGHETCTQSRRSKNIANGINSGIFLATHASRRLINTVVCECDSFFINRKSKCAEE
jgi:hypothetical protein